MRTLIDGYNLMFAAGVLGRRLGPDGLRKVRHRFLNDLAAKLDPVEAHQTTIVFDASTPPADRPGETSHKGLSIVYAVDDEDADARIERLIASHPAPRTLTVVSSDHRIRQAAARRRARALTAEEFLDELDARGKRTAATIPPPRASDEERARLHGLSPAEAREWLDVFQDVVEDPEVHRALAPDPSLLTDEEIARIEREIEREFGP